ncbi:hypothetical protein I4U23_022200 [Adineta vaga]|nr:hypothetical protein I4U23_022200 [Adineta vaga]
MATDNDHQQEDVSSATTEIAVDSPKRRLWMIICISLGLLIIIAIVVPIMIISLRKTGKTSVTTMNMNASFATDLSTDTTSFTTNENNPTTASNVIVTTTATKPTSLQVFQRTNEVVYGIWNTTAGDISTVSLPGIQIGTYWRAEPPEGALDDNVSTEYTNHGVCGGTSHSTDECGIKTGFYLTFKSKSFILTSFQMATNKDAKKRDPMTITIEGSNNNGSDLTFGNSWTLIYNGSSGLQSVLTRRSFGETQTLVDNVSPFASYRLLVTSKRGEHNSVSYSEFRIMGQYPDENV